MLTKVSISLSFCLKTNIFNKNGVFAAYLPLRSDLSMSVSRRGRKNGRLSVRKIKIVVIRRLRT